MSKVAIIDGGFAGYRDRQASGDLPASLITQNLCSGGFEGDDHGTGVAEIVHEMAPSAQLYLVCGGTEVEVGRAKDYAKSVGAQIISSSIGSPISGRGDGTGGPGSNAAIVADARASGILWVNAAGNYGRTHWSGTFVDADGDGLHHFTPVDEGNTIVIPEGGTVDVSLKWDDWPASAQDYDLWFGRQSDFRVVARSENLQNGIQRPTEYLTYTNPGPTQAFDVLIVSDGATRAPRFDLYIDGASSSLQYQVREGGIAEPATSPHVMAVGAACWQSGALEPYSSSGPTIDGRIKPDIAGPDDVSSATYGASAGCGQAGGFSGTSASAPHVGGAAALVKHANPTFGPAQIQAFLEQRAVDAAPTGKDNGYGAGRLALGAPPSTSAPPPTNAVDLAASLTVSPATVARNGAVTMTATATNVGGGAAAGPIRLILKVPQSLGAVSATAGGQACQFEAAAQRGKLQSRVLCLISGLTDGQTVTATATAAASQSGPLPVVARVKPAPGASADPKPANNQVGQTVTVAP